jgi:CBS domain-containing protein
MVSELRHADCIAIDDERNGSAMLRAQQLMTQNVQYCRPNDTLDVAARLMWDHDLGAVPVIDEDGRAVAMITDRDACMASYLQGRPLSSVRVGDVMSRSLVSVRAEDPVSKALDVMGEHQVRRLAVLDAEGRLAGVLSMSDLVREAARERENPDRELSAIAVVASLGAVSQPRYGALAPRAA